jgi:hypothetical protein
VRAHRALLIGGGATLGVAYVLGIVVGATQFSTGGVFTVIPVAGPFIAAAAYRSPPILPCAQFTTCTVEGPGGGLNASLYEVPLYLLGGVQIVGAGLLIGGLAARRPYLEVGSGITIRPVPLTGRDRGGMALEGTF